jgi:hypothetical protein
MARGSRGPANTVEQSVQQQLDNLANRVRELETKRILASQLYVPDDGLDPVEGEHIIDPDDDRHAWYSNGAWHKAGIFKPSGIIRSVSTSGDSTSPSDYRSWGTSDVTYISRDGIGEHQFVDPADLVSDVFSIDLDNYPYVMAFAEEAGLYLVSIHLHWGTVSFPETQGEIRKFLNWRPGGWDGGGAGFSEYTHEYVDSGGLASLVGAGGEGMDRNSLVWVPPSNVPDGLNMFRPWSDIGESTVHVSGSCWHIAGWQSST